MESTKEVADCALRLRHVPKSHHHVNQSSLAPSRTSTILTSAAEKEDYITLLGSTNTALRHQHHLSFVHRLQDGSEGFHRHLFDGSCDGSDVTLGSGEP